MHPTDLPHLPSNLLNQDKIEQNMSKMLSLVKSLNMKSKIILNFFPIGINEPSRFS